jgi:hypothetical protein
VRVRERENEREGEDKKMKTMRTVRIVQRQRIQYRRGLQEKLA